MNQLTLKEIPLEDAMNSGYAVLAQWDELKPHWGIVKWNYNAWCSAEDSLNGDTFHAPSRVYELPGGVE